MFSSKRQEESIMVAQTSRRTTTAWKLVLASFLRSPTSGTEGGIDEEEEQATALLRGALQCQTGLSSFILGVHVALTTDVLLRLSESDSIDRIFYQLGQ